MSGIAARWRRAVTCSIWPAAIPLAFYWHALHNLSAFTSVEMRAGVEHLARRAMVVVPAASFLLALLSCWAVSCLVGTSGQVRAVRNAVLFATLAAFVVAPWFTSTAMSGMVTENLIESWVMPGALLRSMPCICALMAAASFAMFRGGRTLAERPAA